MYSTCQDLILLGICWFLNDDNPAAAISAKDTRGIVWVWYTARTF